MGRIDTYVADEFNVSKSCDYYLFHLSSAGRVNYMHTSPDDFKLLLVLSMLPETLSLSSLKRKMMKKYHFLLSIKP